MKSAQIAAYDFDGTITDRDTFIDFVVYTNGYAKCLFAFVLFFPLIVAVKLGVCSNERVKQRIFSYFFKGIKIENFTIMCDSYCDYRFDKIVRDAARESIVKHTQEGHITIVVSASPENWIVPFAQRLGMNYVIATEIETDSEGRLTGDFLSNNCYGKEKVLRLMKMFPNRDSYYLVAYGDSKGDKDLLDFADEKYYKTFF